jgi:hypothetical protein
MADKRKNVNYTRITKIWQNGLNSSKVIKKLYLARRQWLTAVILTTQEAEIRRTEVQSQPRQIVHKTLSSKTHHKKRAGGVAQGVGPKFKPQYCTYTRKNKNKTKKMYLAQEKGGTCGPWVHGEQAPNSTMPSSKCLDKDES